MHGASRKGVSAEAGSSGQEDGTQKTRCEPLESGQQESQGVD
jgi:hypothetical protein